MEIPVLWCLQCDELFLIKSFPFLRGQACKAVAPLFYHLATQYPDTIFVDVPVTPQNAALHQGLGVRSLPFGHIYHPQEGLVEEVKLTRKHMLEFRDKLDQYVRPSSSSESSL